MFTKLRRSIAVLVPTTILALAAATAFAADNVTADNQIFTGKTCLGAVCADGETFGALPLKIKKTDTPGIQFEQTNGGGFTAQTWDIAGNEANFFVRDITGGSRLPFRIRPGARTSALDLLANAYASTSGVFAFDTAQATNAAAYDTSNILNGLSGITFETYKVNGNADDVHLQPVVGPFSTAYFGNTQQLAPADIAAVALAAAQRIDAKVNALPNSSAYAQRLDALEASNTTLKSDVSKLKKQNKSMAKSLKSLQKQVKKLAKRK